MSSALAPRDAERLADLEVTIAQGLTTFVEVGAALSEIREARLYRETHGTFEDYCRERWQMSRPRAYQLIDAAAVVAGLSTTVDTPAPATESQVRPLTKLPPEQQREAWAEAVATAPEGKVTAAHVAATVKKIAEPEGGKVAAAPMAPGGGTGQRDDGPTTHPGSTPFTPNRIDARRLTVFITAAVDAAHAAEGVTDEQIKAIAANDLMLAGLRKARDLTDRIIRQHSAVATSASA